MGDYHDLYLKSDILILADVFETFRKTRKQYYNLDPVHYLSCPDFAWDAVLKMASINIELITDIDMYQMVEKGFKAVLLLWFLTITCSCCLYLYFGSAIMLVIYFSKL